jgi:hypothetical protein
MRHPLESKFVHEGRPPRLLLAVAGGMAAGIGASVIAALVFSPWLPSYKKATPRNSPLPLLHRLDRLKQLKRRPNNPKRRRAEKASHHDAAKAFARPAASAA